MHGAMTNPQTKSPRRPPVLFPNGKPLDPIDWQLLELLEKDARTSLHELGRRVGMTAPAVGERVRRLEAAGIIEGYRAVIRPERIGFPLTAFVRMVSNPERYYERLATVLGSLPNVREAHHVVGGDSFIAKMVAQDIADLERLIGKLTTQGSTVTSVVLSTPVARSSSVELAKL
jgi:Lrp/AsnC family leucine-responsive transcriptional regulator